MRSALLLFCALSAASAEESRVLVRTVTTSAIGEAHGVYVHTVDIDGGVEIGIPLSLPADAPTGRMYPSGDGRLAATAAGSTRLGSGPQSGVAVFSTLPVPPYPRYWFDRPGDVTERIAGFVPLDSHEWLVSFGPTTLPNTTVERGSIALHPLDARGAATGPARRQLLPGVPADGVTFGDRASVAVLAWDDETSLWAIHVFDGTDGGTLQSVRIPAEGSRFSGDAALGLTRGDGYLIAVVPDQATGASGARSHMFAVGTKSMKLAGEPVPISGSPAQDRAVIVSASENSAWIATRDPISAFGYTVYIEIDERGVDVKDDPSYTTVDASPIVSPQRKTNRVAIAIGNRVEIRRAGEGADGRHAFAASIRALAWHGDHLLVGEGGRIHRFDVAEMSIASTVQFQDGRVDDIVPIPDRAWHEDDADGDGLDKREELQLNGRVFDADSDGDGLLDGVDPDVRVASPLVAADREIRLRASAAGYESRIFRIETIPSNGGEWTIEYDASSAPWLRVQGLAGSLPGGPVFSLDPGALPKPEGLETSIGIRVVGPDGEACAGSPITVRVRVEHESATRRSVAWVLGEPKYLERAVPLASYLSGTPFHLSQRFDASTLALDSGGDSILIMDEAAAAQSLVTRRAVSDFVRAGRGLVFLRSQSAIQAALDTEAWLSPFGVTLTREAAATSPAVVRGPLARWWRPNWQAAGGTVFTVAANGEAAYVHTGSYGLGRFAVLASADPLLGTDNDRRRFAAELIAWLARAPLADAESQRDSDSDGLPDWVEDRDRSGFREAGETDWANADTDGDGLPDGAEDVNLNGILDAGETSPLIFDTDGDTIGDGADATPIPPFAAPLIAAVFPDSAPAQGGRTVMIQGRNLRSNQRVWFGDRLATDVRAADSNTLSVTVPPASLQTQSPAVDIRVEDTDTGLDRTASGLFTYSPAALVQIGLHPVAEAARPNGGVVALRVSSSEKVSLGRVALTLETDPQNALAWGPLDPGVASSAQGRSVTGSTGSDSALSIAIGAPRHAQGMGQLVTIPWTVAGDSIDSIEIKIRSAKVTADNGYPLRVDTSSAILLQ